MTENYNEENEQKGSRFWYRQKVIDHIQDYQRKNSTQFERTLRSNYDLDDYELLRASRLFFGSWQKAVDTALPARNSTPGRNKIWKINGSMTPIDARSISKDRLLEIVRKLSESGEDMSPENMVIMHNDIWKLACGSGGYFSHWPTVLRKAGIDTNVLERDTFWTEARLKNRIFELYESQLFLSTYYIKDNFRYLYRIAQRYNGRWPDAVNSTGLGYDIIEAEREGTGERQKKFQENLMKILLSFGRPVVLLNGRTLKIGNSEEPLGLFAFDSSEPAVIGTLMRSWWPKLESMLLSVSKSNPSVNIELYYLSGEPRSWTDERVKFIPASDLIEPSREAGSDQYMRDILTLQYHVPSFL